jgi:hypothetical protein
MFGSNPKKLFDDNFGHDKKQKRPSAQSKSLAALPCKLRFAAKHLLFCYRASFVDK